MRYLIALAACLAACAPPPAAISPGASAGAREAIVATSREFSARYERGDAAGMVDLYTLDGVILPPGRSTIGGREPLVRFWTLAEGVRVLEHRATPDSIVVAGPVAYDWGRFFVRTRDAQGAERATHGKYVIVWRETAPGTWRMHVGMWNAAPAP